MEQITDPGAFIMTIANMVLIVLAGYLLYDYRAALVRFCQNVWERYTVSNVFPDGTDHSVDQQPQTTQTDQADRQTDPVSVHPLTCSQLQLDRTRLALIRVLVYNGWSVGQVRSVLKGDNNTIGQEVSAAREQLQVPPAQRIIQVREDDEQYELALHD